MCVCVCVERERERESQFSLYKEWYHFEPNYVHILPTAHKENCWHNVTLAPLGTEFYRAEKNISILERLEQFEPKSVHILPTTNKEMCVM